MGSTSWNDTSYTTRTANLKSSGKDFGYHKTVSSKPRSEQKVHEDLNPFGVKMRESRDSDAHPTSIAVAVGLDVTGSMSTVPVVMQEKLGGLMKLLLAKSYLEHPQIMFSAIGDANSDRAPLQVGQFESGLEMDDDLQKLFLEGNGGGQMMESYELYYYFMAKHTSIDCWEKRKTKGYLFTVGDELCYDKVSAAHVKNLIGDGLQEDIPTADIVKACQEFYNCYHIIPAGTSHSGDSKLLHGYEYRDSTGSHTAPGWTTLLGQNVIQLDNPSLICETIAAAIGLAESVVSLDDVDAHLEDAGMSSGGGAVSKALATMAENIPAKSATVSGDMAPSGDTSGRGAV